MNQKAWIVGPYGNNGGNNMNFHIGKVCKELIGLETYSISIGPSQFDSNNVFNNEYLFEECTVDKFLTEHQPKDILISNPSFSPQLFGHKASCNKIMYVQGFSTYRIIDARFDQYVAVSKFVQSFLKNVYNLDSIHIPAFIKGKSNPTPFAKKRNAILLYKKDDHPAFNYYIEQITKMLAEKGLKLEIVILEREYSNLEIIDKIDQYKYLLTLSEAEGFGLVPLEAMSCGSIVFGFNGYGGRDFLKSGINCMTNDYPHLEKIVESIIYTSNHSEIAQELSHNAIATAASYCSSDFKKRWIQLLEPMVH